MIRRQCQLWPQERLQQSTPISSSHANPLSRHHWAVPALLATIRRGDCRIWACRKGVHNDGVKIAANDGTAVLVTAPGTVAYVGDNLKSFGTLVLVKHEGGYISAYAHLGAVRVAEGDVLAGMTLGQVGQTGNVTTPQLHFEIRRARQPVNPRTLIAS